MSLVTRAADASIDTSTAAFAGHIAGDLFAGEALDPLAPCYIKQADGLVYMSNGTAATEPAGFAGFTPTSYAIGEAVTLLSAPMCFRYSSTGALTPGAKYYIAATKGRLDTGATTGDAVGVVRAVNAYDVQITRFI